MLRQQTFDDLVKALTDGDRNSAKRAITEIAGERVDRPGYLPHMARIVFAVWQTFFGRGSQLGKTPPPEMFVDLTEWVSSLDGSGPLRQVHTALDYLLLWAETSQFFRSRQLERVRHHKLAQDSQLLDELREMLDAIGSRVSTSYGAQMFEAMLTSLNDRDETAKLFKSAIKGNEEFVAAPFLDQYVSTYFTRNMIHERSAEIKNRRRALVRSFEMLDSLPQGAERTLLLFSSDPTFFAIYFPYWASTIQYLQDHDIDLHFILVGDKEQTSTAVRNGSDLVRSISRLRSDQRQLPKNVSFSHVPVPAYVAVPETFYACARYLLASKFKAQTNSRIIVLDMDMTLINDPTGLFVRLAELDENEMPLAIAGGASSLVPARRYIANTFPVPTGAFGDRVMREIEDYIYVGLPKTFSWTLDQNALAYMAEYASASVGVDSLIEIARLGRPPLSQLASINGLYETAQRQRDGGSAQPDTQRV